MKTLILITLLFAFESYVYATEYDNYWQGDTGMTGATGMTGQSGAGANRNEFVGATAAALAASGLQFDLNTNKLQFGVAVATFNVHSTTEEAMAVGLADSTNIGKTKVLFSGAFTRSRSGQGVVGSATFAF